MAKPSRRIVGFSGLCVVCILIAAIYVVRARMQLDPNTGLRNRTAASSPREPVSAVTDYVSPVPEITVAPSMKEQQALSAPPDSPRSSANKPDDKAGTATEIVKQPHLLFRSTALDDTFGRLGFIPLKTLAGPRTLTTLRCERVHFAGGYGVCLVAERGVITTYRAVIFDTNFKSVRQLSLGGVPSRVRVAPNGQVAAITVFVSGHSYSAPGFSTLTTFVNLNTGELLVDNIEKFSVSRNGERFHAADFNFWGVTFARDSNRFYATVASEGRTHLIEGDLNKRDARVIQTDIECPSLSPDNTRVGFKKRFGGALTPVTWRLSVLDLKTLNVWPLAETRSVDDQVEWLDNDHVIYSLPDAETSTPITNAWLVAAGGREEPKQLLAKAYSPVVVLR